MNNNNNNRSNNCATPAIDNTPCLNDILLGKGHHRNPGNLWLVQYLLKHKAEYQQMSRDCKGELYLVSSTSLFTGFENILRI